MKHHATTPYDSTHSQQPGLLSISHPQEWNAACWPRSSIAAEESQLLRGRWVGKTPAQGVFCLSKIEAC
jgi:hypothetical protein